MSERTYRWLFWTLALIGLAGDQVGKYTAFHWLYQHGTQTRYNPNVLQHEIMPGVFRLSAEFQSEEEGQLEDSWLNPLRTISAERQPPVNHGALFGFLGWLKFRANTFFAGISLLAAAVIVYYSLGKTMARDRVLCASLGL